MKTKHSLTRRRFLAAAATATSAALVPPWVVPSSVLGAAGAVAPNNRVTLGFIGTGKMARDYHLSTLSGFNDVECAAVCDKPLTLTIREAHHFDIAQWALGLDQSGPVEIIPPEDATANTGAKLVFAEGVEMIHPLSPGQSRVLEPAQTALGRAKLAIYRRQRSQHLA